MGLISTLAEVIARAGDDLSREHEVERKLSDPREEYIKMLEQRVEALTVANTNLYKRAQLDAQVVAGAKQELDKLGQQLQEKAAENRRLVLQLAQAAPLTEEPPAKEEPPLPPAGIAPPPKKPAKKKETKKKAAKK